MRIPQEAWIFFSYECCVLSVRGLSDELISRREDSYRLLCVAVRDLENLIIRRPCSNGGFAPEENNISNIQTARQDVGETINLHKVL